MTVGYFPSAEDGQQLYRVADLLRARNAIDGQISAVVGRPMVAGHLGEWIAARVFGIAPAPSATTPGVNGWFTAGALRGRSVNVKWYLRREGVLDVNEAHPADFYLVLTGPPGVATHSRGAVRPWCVTAVYLFDVQRLLGELRARRVKIGTASSVRAGQWAAAEVFPRAANPALVVQPQQARLLWMFAAAPP